MPPIPKHRKKSRQQVAQQQGGSDCAAAVIAQRWRWRWTRGGGGSAALLWHDCDSRCHPRAATARRCGCDEDTSGGQHGIIGESTAVESAVAVAAAQSVCDPRVA